MPWYRCSVRGENFPLSVLGGLRGGRTNGHAGFYATRWVEAADRAEAEHRCIDLVKRDPALAHQRVLNSSPTLHVEKIEELAGEPEQHPGSGFSFYVE
jgi:hypothetical protein